MWCTHVMGAQWVGHSCMTGAPFGLIHAWVYGCLVLGRGSPGLSGMTINLRYITLFESCNGRLMKAHG